MTHADRYTAAMTALRTAAARLSDLEIAAEFGEVDADALATARAEFDALAEKTTAAEFRMRAADQIANAAAKGLHVYVCTAASLPARVMLDTNGKRAARRYAPRSMSHNDVSAPRANATTLAAFLRERAGV